jgi:hypothetical protein
MWIDGTRVLDERILPSDGLARATGCKTYASCGLIDSRASPLRDKHLDVRLTNG